VNDAGEPEEMLPEGFAEKKWKMGIRTSIVGDDMLHADQLNDVEGRPQISHPSAASSSCQ
jgi:hypothetical protein